MRVRELFENKINPALMTYKEYRKLVDPDDKFHPDSAYDLSVKQLNAYSKIEEFPILINTISAKGLSFQIRRQNSEFSDKPMIGVFNDKKQKVAAVQDEWGCLLIMVAREYRGFGFGPMLTKIMRSEFPDYHSGGFTSAGSYNFKKVYSSFVKDALSNGLYRDLVKRGELSIDRVKDILNSVPMKGNLKPKSDVKLDTSNPRNWLIYEEYGAFIIYDKKLFEFFSDDAYRKYEGFEDEAVKGFILTRINNNREQNVGLMVRFGGQNNKIKSFLIQLSASWCVKEQSDFYVDDEDINLVDPKKFDIGPSSKKTGISRHKVVVKPDYIIDIDLVKSLEAQYRKVVFKDQYDEFKNYMLEKAEAIWPMGNNVS